MNTFEIKSVGTAHVRGGELKGYYRDTDRLIPINDGLYPILENRGASIKIGIMVWQIGIREDGHYLMREASILKRDITEVNIQQEKYIPLDVLQSYYKLN